MRPTQEEIDQELGCAEGYCGHHPQLDCDTHHPNKILAAAYRAKCAELEILQRDYKDARAELGYGQEIE